MIDTRGFGRVGFQPLTLGDLGPDEFIFPMSPRSMDLNEPAAVTIVPTQGGGQFIEHQGQIYKNIVLVGTTGLRPNKGQSPKGIIPIPPQGIPGFAAAVDSETLLPTDEGRTGFEELLQLRNLFRRYTAQKTDPTLGATTVMVWQNGKDGEYYVVEPISFRTRRDSASPVTANYEIVLRTIGPVQKALFSGIDVRDSLKSNLSLLQRMTRLNRSIADALNVAAGFADNVASRGQATLTTILGPVNAVLQGLQAITRAGQRFLTIPRNTLSGVSRDAFALANELQSASRAYTVEGILTQDMIASAAYKLMGISIARVAAEDSLFDESLNSRMLRKAQAYRDPTNGAPRSGGSLTNLSNAPIPTAAAVTTVTNFDTVFGIAQRLLGDQSRWKEIVVLNDLKAPYFSESGDGISVLRPGDTVLFPSTSAIAGTGVSEDLSTADALAKRLGRDLKLSSFQSFGGSEDFDLSVNQRGDLDVISGIPNMKQAVRIKFGVEQGTLPTHPSFGIEVPIGSKINVRSLIGFKLNAIGSLLQDNRISDVSELSFETSGNVVTVTAYLTIASVDSGISVSFQARR